MHGGRHTPRKDRSRMGVYIIAEAGSAHDGDQKKAYALVDEAASAGADAVKFQYWSSPERMRERRKIADESSYKKEMIFANWLPLLRDRAHRFGLEFMCTAYLPEDIVTVANMVDKFKIASFESQDESFVSAHAEYKKPTIISLGMNGRRIEIPFGYYLHCVSAYPAPVSDANLGVIRGNLDGFSDHTLSLISGAVAVAVGATIIEKHIRLDTTSPNCPDYPHSLPPARFVKYVRHIREAEVLIGDGEARVMPSEAENVQHRVSNV
jgi:N,N'-diacetyllegionaminate synthase